MAIRSSPLIVITAICWRAAWNQTALWQNLPADAVVIQKALSNSELDDVEITQLHYFIRQRMAQAAMMRRLYVEGYATPEDVRRAYTGLRRYAGYDVFRREYKNIMSERNQRMVFEEDGVTWWLNAIDNGEMID